MTSKEHPSQNPSQFATEIKPSQISVAKTEFSSSGESILRKNKISVSITNNITDTKLRVHCKDKNIDLGSFKLKYRETRSFSFRPCIIVKAELYFCRFSWLNEFHYFEIYKK